MIRPLAALAFLAIGLGAATAQDALPAQPAPSDIVVDPAAPIDTTPKQANLLTGLYATRAVIELCSVTVAENVLAGIDIDQKRLETGLGMDAATAEKAYVQVKSDVEKTTPDCARRQPRPHQRRRCHVHLRRPVRRRSRWRRNACSSGHTRSPRRASPCRRTGNPSRACYARTIVERHSRESGNSSATARE